MVFPSYPLKSLYFYFYFIYFVRVEMQTIREVPSTFQGWIGNLEEILDSLNAPNHLDQFIAANSSHRIGPFAFIFIEPFGDAPRPGVLQLKGVKRGQIVDVEVS
jgi:hypothetical protein